MTVQIPEYLSKISVTVNNTTVTAEDYFEYELGYTLGNIAKCILKHEYTEGGCEEALEQACYYLDKIPILYTVDSPLKEELPQEIITGLFHIECKLSNKSYLFQRFFEIKNYLENACRITVHEQEYPGMLQDYIFDLKSSIKNRLPLDDKEEDKQIKGDI